jgi:hypothetical protein
MNEMLNESSLLKQQEACQKQDSEEENSHFINPYENDPVKRNLFSNAKNEYGLKTQEKHFKSSDEDEMIGDREMIRGG